MEPCSMICGSLDGKRVCETTDTCICMAESFCCSLENIIILLIGHTPVQHVLGVKKLKLKTKKYVQAPK